MAAAVIPLMFETGAGEPRRPGRPVEIQVAGARLQFLPGESSCRDVVINGSLHVNVAPGISSSISTGGLHVRVQAGQLFINGQRVDFSLRAAARPEAEGEALRSLRARYPGVVFCGDPKVAAIHPSARIAPGAHVTLTRGLVIGAGVSVGAGAHVSGGQLYGSRVDGSVSGGNLERSAVAAGAQVAGGHIVGSRLSPGARVFGGSVVDMVIEAGAKVFGGHLSGFVLAAGQRVSDGRHEGGLTEPSSPGKAEGGVVVGIGAVVRLTGR